MDGKEEGGMPVLPSWGRLRPKIHRLALLLSVRSEGFFVLLPLLVC